jgi:hypothetical protein
VQIVAAGALGTLAYNAENRKAIVGEGAISALVGLLGAENGEDGQESAAVALANLMTGDESRCLAVDAGAVPPLVGMLENGPPETQEAAAQALGGLAKSAVRGSPPLQPLPYRTLASPHLATFCVNLGFFFRLYCSRISDYMYC